MATLVPRHGEEPAARFAFGANWRRFLHEVDDEAVERATASLREMLALDHLAGRTFLDVGSGSGLFSLAARRLGGRVVSFDVDPDCVACTRELKRRFAHNDDCWTVHDGSLLDSDFLDSLGRFDIVYAWGVVHHTGRLWDALANAASRVASRGTLFVAIYNDQGRASIRWRRIKWLYNRLPHGLRWVVLWPAFVRVWGPTSLRDLLRGRPAATWRNYRATSRGMSPWRDVVDWVGGYPFEVARPDEVVESCRSNGFELVRRTDCGGGRGCNEFVFRRIDDAAPANDT